ncbi:MAG: SH3 domain-containing protein [Parachlamydiaceae bacterium]
MRKGLFFACASVFCCVGQMSFAAAESSQNVSTFSPFTGKVISNKVRLRNQPNLDGQIIKELKKGDMLVVLGESDDFYTVQPPSDIKAYVFRTFVLDNQIEGSNVNVRLGPDLESPIIAKLSSGDRVDGLTLCSTHNKWFEITPPASARFYVAKDYIEKIGDASLMAKLLKKEAELSKLLDSTIQLSTLEMGKDYPEVNLEAITKNYHFIIQNGHEFPAFATQAKEQLAQLQEDYLNKKIAYLEAKAFEKPSISPLVVAKPETATVAPVTTATLQPAPSSQGTLFPIAWAPKEESIYEFWLGQNGKGSVEDFYAEQKKRSLTLQGRLELYNHTIKNRPGDYVLVSKDHNQPIAYLYSTMVDLDDKIGNEITLEVVERPNNHFAYPAYFVLSAN